MDRVEPSFDLPPHSIHGGHDDPFQRLRYYDPASHQPHGHDPHAYQNGLYEHHAAHAQLHRNAPNPYPEHDDGGANYHHGRYGDNYPTEHMEYRPRRRFLGRVPLIAGALILGIWVPITFNAMWMQDGPHPAPFFADNQYAPVANGESATVGAQGTAPVSTPRQASARDSQTVAAAQPAAAPAAEHTAQSTRQSASHPTAAPAPSRDQIQLAKIQTVLQRLRLYDGAIDGLYGPRTRAAIEAFETGHGLTVSGHPSSELRTKLGLPATSSPGASGIDNLLGADPTSANTLDLIAQAIIDNGDRQPPAPTTHTQSYAPVQPPVPATGPGLPQPGLAPPTGVQTISITPPTPATALLEAERPRSDDPRVLHVQRLLADLAYAPGSIDGQPGPSTRAAIMRFEADRNMAQTGQITDELLDELAAITGVRYGG